MAVIGVDNAIQFTIVTAAGEHVTANSYQNTDLFWALRGGGGGTYGIVTSVTYRTYPIIPLTGVFFSALTTNTTIANKLVVEFLRIHPTLSDEGWSGYSTFNSTTLGFLYLAPNSSSTATIESFFAFAQNLTSEGLTISIAMTVPFPSFYVWYNALFSTGSQVGVPTEVGSRLLSRELVANDYTKVAQVLLNLQTGGVSW